MNKHLKYNLLGLSVMLFLLTACSSKFTKLQKSGTTAEKYQAALGYYNAKDYNRAGLLFEELSPILRGDSTAENVQFFNAYCNYYQGLYQMSSYLFKNFYATYANSPKAEEAFYMYAYSLFKDSPKYDLDQTSTKDAIDALQMFINTFPQSEYAPKSAQNLIDLRNRLERKDYERTKQYYITGDYLLSNYKAATIAVDNFMKDFPDSPYREELYYIQLDAEYKLAASSIFKLQKERYEKAIAMYQHFVDNYPNSKYIKDAAKIYDKSQAGLEEVNKLQALVDAEKTQASAGVSN